MSLDKDFRYFSNYILLILAKLHKSLNFLSVFINKSFDLYNKKLNLINYVKTHPLINY
ncbi:hypothetical protein HMPREF9444_02028 [Succinatimonas hippei YIT 12066]|uniref:Uncharacterized protein n=1 Tax=Succinatimonas hippei (strain DSM 22608 / JCM 16073 / KCTC 15190 / YIT 12066) TaxID=762983 RepID=E8LMN4_SUCHY|nr:hypothetical protein HMPREF9444_02028 [Succinatimonas hippei YIT 12066]